MPPDVGSISRVTQRATVDLPEPLSPTMPSVRPRFSVKLTSSAATVSAVAAEQERVAIDFAEAARLQHDLRAGLGADRRAA